MNKKQLVLDVVHTNWSIEPDSWLYTRWLVYDDQSIQISDKYGFEGEPHEQDQTLTGFISDSTYKLLLQLIPSLQASDRDIFALDGDGWQFTYYQDGKQAWKRDAGYIYGLKPFLQYTAILESVKKRLLRGSIET